MDQETMSMNHQGLFGWDENGQKKKLKKEFFELLGKS